MPVTIIVGSQWGDEGKGRITDLLAAEADIVARYSGGDNAGHTVTVGDEIFKLHLVPSGIVQPNTVSVMGAGMVINPRKLIAEMDGLAARGIDVSPRRLKLSAGSHLILPTHIALDGASEEALGRDAIGTTRRGIGPAYTDKATRVGLRAGDMLAADFPQRVFQAVEAKNRILVEIYGQEPLDAESVADEYAGYAERLRPHIADVSREVHQVLKAGGQVLAEGAQGTLLDINHGTYPYVTSSSPIAGGVLTSLGIGPKEVDRVIGVAKAFQTRVGEGPMPTELTGPLGDALRGTGEHPWDEFGTTTGRPRRCGWLDLVLLRYAARVNGLTGLVVTKLDVLTGLDPLRVCVAYAYQGKEWDDLPFGPNALGDSQPIYADLPGWTEDITGARAVADLPPAAQEYLDFIHQQVGVPILLASVGPEREQAVQINPI
jgi:adenylosuccinate synthase